MSIAVPIFNSARFLPAALDSLVAQEEPRWEALLWDDGSTDGSGEIAAHYAGRDARFRLLGDGRNHGNPRALAQALAMARSDFLGVLDGDDVLDPRALGAMLAFMQEHPRLGMAYSQYLEIDEDGHALGPGGRFRIPYSPERLLVEFMTFHFRLIRAGVYRAIGGYDGSLDESADYDLCLRLSERTCIGHLPELLYRYRIRRDSVSCGQRLRQVRTAFDAAQRALHRRGLADRHVLSLGVRARHVLRPNVVAVAGSGSLVGAGDADAEQCLRLAPPFDPASAAEVGDWAEQIEQHYRVFAAQAQRSGLDARYDCALEIDSWHVLQPLRPFGGTGNWR